MKIFNFIKSFFKKEDEDCDPDPDNISCYSRGVPCEDNGQCSVLVCGKSANHIAERVQKISPLRVVSKQLDKNQIFKEIK